MNVDNVTGILSTGGVWGLYLYIILKDLIPKLFPQILKSYDKRVSTEERLFGIISETNKQSEKLAVALNSLAEAISNLSHRVEKVEDHIEKSIDKNLIETNK